LKTVDCNRPMCSNLIASAIFIRQSPDYSGLCRFLVPVKKPPSPYLGPWLSVVLRGTKKTKYFITNCFLHFFRAKQITERDQDASIASAWTSSTATKNHGLAGSRERRHYLHHDYAEEKKCAWNLLGDRLSAVLPSTYEHASNKSMLSFQCARRQRRGHPHRANHPELSGFIIRDNPCCDLTIHDEQR